MDVEISSKSISKGSANQYVPVKPHPAYPTWAAPSDKKAPQSSGGSPTKEWGRVLT